MNDLNEALRTELGRAIKREDLSKVNRLLDGLLCEEWIYAQLLWTTPMEATKRLDLVGFGPHHQAQLRLDLGTYGPDGRPVRGEAHGDISPVDFSRIDVTALLPHESPSSATDQPVTFTAVVHRPDRGNINLGGHDGATEGTSIVTLGSLADLMRAWLGYPLTVAAATAPGDTEDIEPRAV